MTFANKLKNARIKAGYTQAELSQLVGTTPQSISCYENGRFVPHKARIARLADILQIPFEELLDDEDLERIRSGIERQSERKRIMASLDLYTNRLTEEQLTLVVKYARFVSETYK